MFKAITKYFIGSRNDRILKSYKPLLNKINQLDGLMAQKSDIELEELSSALKMLSHTESQDSIKIQAFALAREIARRELGIKAFDVQILAGLALCDGKIAEMQTGEGKTLASIFPIFFKSLIGEKVHVVTANPYLAERDALYLRPVFTKLGISVGVNTAQLNTIQKQAVYQSDVLYGTASEFGFDYLRDNMANSLSAQVGGVRGFVLIDEIDSVLIDDASTPLIISGASNLQEADYKQMDLLAKELILQHSEDAPLYEINHETRQININDSGYVLAEILLVRDGLLPHGENLYHQHNLSILHRFLASMRANVLYHKDAQYLVAQDGIEIIDESTGRVMEGRRWSDGLHQAVEAKEGLAVQPESRIAATISIQNYFKMYQQMAGMTGTADTDSAEFMMVYGLEVVVIPRNLPLARIDLADRIFANKQDKYKAVLADVQKAQTIGQPVLLAVPTVAVAQEVANVFSQAGLGFNLLSAKDPEGEAHIIENAGKLGALTIATNMAGRGTDIKLGGADDLEREKVLAVGGLYVLGVEHHNSRRTDNQLRGRSGRQGDVGLSQFFLSFDDSFFLPFGKMAFAGVSKILADSSNGYTGKLLDDVIKMAHRKIESTFFDARKYMIEFDNIMNQQRAHVYQWRQEVLRSTSMIEESKSNRLELLKAALDEHFHENSISEQWDLKAAHHDFHFLFNLNFDFHKILEEDDHHEPEKMRALLSQIITESVDEKFAQYPAEWVNELMKQSLLQSIDQNWIENINELELLKSSIQLRSYAQKDPKQEYAREAYVLFERLIDTTKKNWNRYLHAVTIQVQGSPTA